jgi:hypothetical protein
MSRKQIGMSGLGAVELRPNLELTVARARAGASLGYLAHQSNRRAMGRAVGRSVSGR